MYYFLLKNYDTQTLLAPVNRHHGDGGARSLLGSIVCPGQNDASRSGCSNRRLSISPEISEPWPRPQEAAWAERFPAKTWNAQVTQVQATEKADACSQNNVRA